MTIAEPRNLATLLFNQFLESVKGQVDRESIGKRGNRDTNPDPVQIAVSCSDPEVFLWTGHLFDERWSNSIGGMMEDAIEREDPVSYTRGRIIWEEMGRSGSA